MSFSFSNLFYTTNRGLPLFTQTVPMNVPASINMSFSYFIGSCIFQVFFFLLFLTYLILAIIRVIKKIKNQRFEEIKSEEQKKNVSEFEEEAQPKQAHQNVVDQNLIYRFDQEEQDKNENQKDKRQIHLDKQSQQNQQQIEQPKQQQNVIENEQSKENKSQQQEKQEKKSESSKSFQTYHDQKEESFLQIDSKLLMAIPFMTPFLINNNAFVMQLFTLICLLSAFLSFILINILNVKGISSKYKLLPMVFMFFTLAGFIPFFINDHDIST